MNAQGITFTMNAPNIKTETREISKKRIWPGRILSTLAVLFLMMDGGMKLFKPPVVVESTLRLGYPESSIVGIGILLLVCTIFYIIPRTAILGAVLLTGYLGGAVASQVRVRGPLFSILFPLIFGSLVWCGLWLRDRRLQIVLAGNFRRR